MRRAYLTRLSIMLARNPPLALKIQIFLEEEEQICRWHGSAGEEVGAHPALVEIVWGVLMSEDVDEELASGLEST